MVAEYTGRKQSADENYEVVRKLCLFYNAKCLYECNNKSMFAYFSRMNSVHLLLDTPEYLREKQMVKYSSFGSSSKGVNANAPINNHADELTKEWLLKPFKGTQIIDGVEVEVELPQLFKLRNRALIKELILYNPNINVDRVRAFGMLMIHRQDRMVVYQGNVRREEDLSGSSYLGNDDFFKNNYDNRLAFN